MSTTKPSANGSATAKEPTYFEQQRNALVNEVTMSLEHVLQNLNHLNRNLEAVIAVGNEFSSVEALWSQFENVMAKDKETERAQGTELEGHVEGGAEGEGK
ncbi:hypothetical protein EV356DRAFT_578800 [Viridothelium virens]|uniref:DASH complex subunit DAD1 n=1 Tax=Viridothelium virens TaxID=1048519 RepID=A0A6A6H2K2_VIRVR|nr:hypothetical protein EV356DRAFT_578800 [Viridothelium virens]